MYCKYCKQEKDEKSFEKFKLGNTMYTRKKCTAFKISQQRERGHKTREWLDLYKSQLQCSRCGNSDERVLLFHHTDPKEKDRNIGDAVRLGWSIERILKEIDKCVVLCANCHIITHAELRIREIG